MTNPYGPNYIHDPLAHIQAALEPQRCAGCGAENGFAYTSGDSLSAAVYCPSCARYMALDTEARLQLERMLSPIIQAWATHWDAVFKGVPDNKSKVELILNCLDDSEFFSLETEKFKESLKGLGLDTE